MTDETPERPFDRPTTRAKARDYAAHMNASRIGGYYYAAPTVRGWVVKVIA